MGDLAGYMSRGKLLNTIDKLWTKAGRKSNRLLMQPTVDCVIDP